MIEIGQTKHSATVIRLTFVFAHDDGLPCRRIGTTAQTVWAVQAWGWVRVGGVLSAIAWFQQFKISIVQKSYP